MNNEYAFSITIGSHIFNIRIEDSFWIPAENDIAALPWIIRNHDDPRGWCFTLLDIRNQQIQKPEQRSPDWLIWATKEWEEYFPLYQQAVIEADKYLGLV